jgi:hypothetical protein
MPPIMDDHLFPVLYVFSFAISSFLVIFCWACLLGTYLDSLCLLLPAGLGFLEFE